MMYISTRYYLEIVIIILLTTYYFHGASASSLTDKGLDSGIAFNSRLPETCGYGINRIIINYHFHTLASLIVNTNRSDRFLTDPCPSGQ